MNRSARAILLAAVILAAFALTATGLVSWVEQKTARRIADNEHHYLLQQLKTIVPAREFDNDLVNDTLSIPANALLGNTQPSMAYVARRNGQISAVIFNVVAPSGYSGPIYLLVGVKRNGELAGVRTVKHKETPGLGDAIEEQKSDWILGFAGKTLDNVGWNVKKDGGDFDQFTGATITPRAVVKAVHNTLRYFHANQARLLGEQSSL